MAAADGGYYPAGLPRGGAKAVSRMASAWSTPHTTAGITITENSDPDVVSDLLFALDQTYPDRPEFQHVEGNSAAHLKAGVMGSSATLLIEKGQLVLGTWQAVYF